AAAIARYDRNRFMEGDLPGELGGVTLGGTPPVGQISHVPAKAASKIVVCWSAHDLPQIGHGVSVSGMPNPDSWATTEAVAERFSSIDELNGWRAAAQAPLPAADALAVADMGWSDGSGTPISALRFSVPSIACSEGRAPAPAGSRRRPR